MITFLAVDPVMDRVDRQVQNQSPIRSAPQPKGVHAIGPPGPWCQNRVFEWVMALALVSIAITVTIWPKSISHSRFWLITEFGVGSVEILIYCLLLGLVRMLALYWNGTWRFYGPRVRAVGCFAGAAVWSQLALALAGDSTREAVSIIVPVLGLLTLGECYSAFRALIDAKINEACG